MIHLIYGRDDYRAREALRALRDELAAGDEMLASNTTVLDGAMVTAGELLAHAQAMPFLAMHRLVIVEGLLRRIGGERRGRARARGRSAKEGDDPLAQWRSLAERLADEKTLPPSTTLVFIEGDLARNNSGFALFAPVARTRDFVPLGQAALEAWVTERADRDGAALTAEASVALARRVGPDLWRMESELRKLADHADGASIDERVVSKLVPMSHDDKFWEMTGAVVKGDEGEALSKLGRLLVEEAPQLLSFMLVREYRVLVIVKDMRERRSRNDETIQAAGIPPHRLNPVAAIAARYTWPRLRGAYRLLLDADLSVKGGRQDDESALQLVIHELCELAPGRAARAVRSR